jgi:Ca2+-binding EF-hand superfamily protein
LTGSAVLEPDPAPEFKALSGGAARVAPPGLTAFYRRSVAGPLQVEWGPRAVPPDSLSQVLIHLLDRDKDGKLSRAELEAAPGLIPRLDTDGVDILTQEVLYREMRNLPANPAGTAPRTEDLPFLMLDPGDPADALVARLLAAYDRDHNGRLGRKEIAFAADLFDRLDADHNGELDPAELARWRDQPADLEVLAPLKGGEPNFVLVGPAAGQPRTLASSTIVLANGTLLVVLPGMRLELVALDAVAAGSRRERDRLLAQFREAGKKDVLEARQMYSPPFTFVGLSRLADRDGDGNLSGRELGDYLDMQEKVVTASTFVTGVNRGRSLFELLDADRDGRLSRRELRMAWQRLAPWARKDPASLMRDEVPRQYLFTLGHGRSPFVQADGMEMALSFRPKARPVGPLWFRKMDRNGDGDVSPAEFLGTAEQFRRIDADGDGLISIEEAERADRELRRR